MSAPRPSLQLDEALKARDRGWRPFPLDHPELPECAGIPPGHHCEPKDRGKHPCVAFGTACATEPPDKLLRHWWSTGPRNVGIACGPSGLVVIDEDEPDALERFAAAQREKLPKTYRVMTSRGWHYYFTAPDDGLVIGNTAGLLGPHGMDVRGGKGGGGYVVAAGSVHHTGHVYVAEDPFLVPAPLPEWLASAILTRPPRVDVPAAGPTGRGSAAGIALSGDWNDEPRYGTAAVLHAQYERHRDAVSGTGDQFRHSLYLAALDGWRLVDLELLEKNAMLGELADRVRAAWNNAPDDRDRQIVYGEARDKATVSPWVVIDPFDPAATSSADGSAPPTAEEIYRRELEHEVKRQRLQRDARRLLAEEARSSRPSIRDGLLDSSELHSIPPPRMLMGELIPHAAMGFLGGDTGTYKSFVAVSWACCLAAGRTWQDRPEFAVPEPVRVLYVAAEGAAGAAQRVQAWMAHHKLRLPAGQLTLYPRAINLTSELEVDELASIVAERGYGMVIVDTLHQSTPGSEDNSATDFGLVFSAMAAIRADHDTTVLFIDHSGHGGTRIRGTAAKGQDSDFVLMAERNGENVPGSQRSLRLHKRKDLATEGRWDIKLRHVELDNGQSSAIVELGQPTGVADIHDPGPGWWSPETGIVLPETVAQLPRDAAGEVARDLYRAMAWVGDVGGPGATRAQMLAYCNEHPTRKIMLNKHGKHTTFDTAITHLRNLGVLVKGSSAQRWTLSPQLPATSPGS